MHGELVSKEEVIAEFERPSPEWERNSRRIEFEKRLKRGESDLGIGGIRGYGHMTGYLSYLERSLQYPLGVGTGLVPPEEDEHIRSELESEIRAEIDKYRARLAELEQSPEAVAEFLADMQSWLDYVEKLAPMDVEDQPDEEFKELARESNKKQVDEIAQLKRDIEAYSELLRQLQAASAQP
jgi:Asp-tRNA(Asn)/Glu-tRNA(Gln) amidotransferase C subunit